MNAPDAAVEERHRIEAAQRDPRPFAALYEAHFERVYAYAVRRVRDRHEAEDVTAESSVRRWPTWAASSGGVFPSRPGCSVSRRTRSPTARSALARERANPGRRLEPEPAPERIEEHAGLYRAVRRSFPPTSAV